MSSCELCGMNNGSRTIAGISFCEDCFDKLSSIRGGSVELANYYVTDQAYSRSSSKAQEYMRKVSEGILRQKNAIRELEIQQKVEIEKQNYANSLGEHYEYNVISAVNTVDGHTDTAKLNQILQEQAKKGWKLHTMYSNELGKNALSILGFGVNSTASEDVMIFERRINDI